MPTAAPKVTFTYTKGDGISYELWDAPPMCVPTTLRTIREDEMQVLAWLQKYRGEIVAAARKHKVDRRAIAGAIAWEALRNVKGAVLGGMRRATGIVVGPGKPHLVEPHVCAIMGSGLLLPCVTDDDTWPRAVEDAGLVKKQTLDDRTALLKTPAGSIEYIAATMDLIAQTYETAGSPGHCEPSIRHNPIILTNVYNGRGPQEWARRVKEIKPTDELKGGNRMDVWVANHMQYLEDGVGTP